MSGVRDVQGLPSGVLLQEYRETLLALGADRANRDLSATADALAVEVDRRMAW